MAPQRNNFTGPAGWESVQWVWTLRLMARSLERYCVGGPFHTEVLLGMREGDKIFNQLLGARASNGRSPMGNTHPVPALPRHQCRGRSDHGATS